MVQRVKRGIDLRRWVITNSARSEGGNTRLWRKIRQRILIRDGYACQYCGVDELKELTIDHIVPLARNGTDDDSNLITACKRCNFSKGAKMGQFFGSARKPPTLPSLFSPPNESKSHA